ncbi:glycosyltransferase [Gryllotalpicola protaetiae]|uniref:4,4'-diaponeurosporenoate glycosyltransferase n=1 Tax=Gryllotalpicola protaetiae TaxID=2419771 RepID=A0A387BMU1_9MICO|nr:glycosyltransferase family A protein [Gryllotalpicola protaetiae]AYG02326.1 glycosyltransferase family 2 protein [Gryllotalpicola protaetiae]
MSAAPIAAVAVVVPVRDEEERLERCLAALASALAAVGTRVATQTMIVLDGCSDRSAQIAARWPFGRIEQAGLGVGRARAAGVEAAIGRLGGIAPDRVWIANTDADSQVPRDWLSRQVDLADGGWDTVLGTVAPDPLDLPEVLRDTSVSHAARSGAPVYGANLGVRASRYLAAGGFAPVYEHEDARLVAALRAGGARITSDRDLTVLTSGRPVGRAPGGYAGYLRRAAELARAAPDSLEEAG